MQRYAGECLRVLSLSYHTQEQFGCCVSSTLQFATATFTAAQVHVTWYEQVAEPLNRLEVEQKVVYPQRNGLVFSLNKPPQLIPKPQAVASLGCGSTPLRIAAYVCAVQQANDVPLFLYFINP